MDAKVDMKQDAGGADTMRRDARTLDAKGDATHKDAGVDALQHDATLDVGSRQDAPPDVQLPDENVCPDAGLEPLFVFDGGLGPILLSDAGAFVEIVNPNASGAAPAPYIGLMACAKKGCDQTPTTLDSFGADAAVQWGGAAVGAGGVYYSTSPLSNDFESDAAPPDAGAIWEEPLSGGSSVAIHGGLGAPFFVAVTPSTAYWVDDPATLEDLAGWSLFRCSLPHCAEPELVMTGGASSGSTYALFLDSTHAYVIANDSAFVTHLYACPLDGGCGDASPPSVLDMLSGPSEETYPADPLWGGDTFVSDGQSIFWMNPSQRALIRVSPVTSATTTLINFTLPPVDLALDTTYLYWALETNSFVQRTRKDGAWGAAWQNVVCGAPDGITNIAIDGTGVYFETVNANVGVTTLWRASLPR
jgi:hypothetical protein